MDLLSNILNYLGQNYIELLATTFGFIYIIFSILEKKLLWLFGFLASGVFVFVFFRAKIYADMGINVYYVAVSVYGWVHWTLYKGEKKTDIPTKRLTLKQWFYVLLSTALLFIFIGFFLDNFTDSDIAYWDAFTTAASIVGTWMLARKILENWLVWIVVDSISVLLYIYKGLYPTTGLFILYTILAIIGFYQWKRSYRKQIN